MAKSLRRLSLKELEMEQNSELSQVLHHTEVMSIFTISYETVINAINVGALPSRRIMGNDFNSRNGWLCSRRYAFSIWGHKLKKELQDEHDKLEHSRQLGLPNVLGGSPDKPEGGGENR